MLLSFSLFPVRHPGADPGTRRGTRGHTSSWRPGFAQQWLTFRQPLSLLSNITATAINGRAVQPLHAVWFLDRCALVQLATASSVCAEMSPRRGGSDTWHGTAAAECMLALVASPSGIIIVHRVVHPYFHDGGKRVRPLM